MVGLAVMGGWVVAGGTPVLEYLILSYYKYLSYNGVSLAQVTYGGDTGAPRSQVGVGTVECNSVIFVSSELCVCQANEKNSLLHACVCAPHTRVSPFPTTTKCS